MGEKGSDWVLEVGTSTVRILIEIKDDADVGSRIADCALRQLFVLFSGLLNGYCLAMDAVERVRYAA
ncbi:MAG: hypothetical protein OHK0012_20730 [Synechococcales cyanobacterium]